MYRKSIFIITLLAVLFPLQAFSYNRDEIKADLQKELRVLVSARDSIRVLTDLFDLANSAERTDIGWTLFKTASRSGNYEVSLDVLRQLTNNYYRQDSMLAVIESYAAKLPESPEQKESLLFIRMQRISAQTRYDSEENRMSSIRQGLSEYQASDTGAMDIYNEILQCYRICDGLGYSATSSLSSEYFKRLKVLIDKLPYGLIGLRSFYYTQAALVYTDAEEYAKAIEADRKLLDIITELERHYEQAGRSYRNYGKSRYNCYRRMLSNYPALTKDEVEKYYKEIKQLAAQDKEIDHDFTNQQRPTMYYLLANERYAEALPIVKRQFNISYSRYYHKKLLKTLCLAAEATRDTATLVKALTEYNQLLEEANKNNSVEAYRELQIRYDISQLKAENSQLELEQLDLKMKADRRLTIITLSAACLLIIVFQITIHRYRKNKKKRNRNIPTDERD